MINKKLIENVTQATEKLVQQYFESKGWVSQKLDKPRKNPVTASDWLFAKDESRFLCEVKTITSARRGIHTEAHFTHFAQTLHEYFSKPSLLSIPFTVQIHSKDIYQPSQHETKGFTNWLESSLSSLQNNQDISGWTCDIMPWGNKLYTGRYTFNESLQSRRHSFSVHVSTNYKGSLEIHTHVYGDFHINKIEDNVLKAYNQLEKTAQRQPNTAIPRVVVIAFEGTSGGDIEPDIDWQAIETKIGELLQKLTNLSTIAIMRFTTPKSIDGNFIDWIVAPQIIYFVVFHNRWLTPQINSLDTSAFLDMYSIQLSLM